MLSLSSMDYFLLLWICSSFSQIVDPMYFINLNTTELNQEGEWGENLKFSNLFTSALGSVAFCKFVQGWLNKVKICSRLVE